MYTVKQFSGSGSRSEFYKLNQRGKGFKTFETRKDAEYARDVQRKLSEWNLAPRVHSEVCRIKIGKRLSAWGYVTQVAKVITPHGACECNDCCDIEDKYSAEIDELQMSIERAGYSFCDAHVGNVGYITKNRKKILVCIDTGKESVERDDYDEDEDICNCYECRKYREEQYA